MKIGLGKEVKTDERRVALTPEGARQLIRDAHSVFVEADAGSGAGFGDEDYAGAGAMVVGKPDLYETCEFILKVKQPIGDEIGLLRPGQVLFTYLHLDENAPPQYALSLRDTGVSAIAYEWVESDDGSHPLLLPMSEITGCLFAKRGIELLTRHKGILAGGYHPKTEPARALLIGLGTIGRFAARTILMNGLLLTICDKHPDSVMERLRRTVPPHVLQESADQIQIIHSSETEFRYTQEAITRELPSCDMLLCAAVRRPSLSAASCPHLITRDMLRKMAPGSVVIDATACDKDLVETAVSSPQLYHTDDVDGVIHYSCDHIPALTPVTSSKLLANATLPYVRALAQNGFVGAVRSEPALARGVMCASGKLVHRYVCEKKGLPWSDLGELLSAAQD